MKDGSIRPKEGVGLSQFYEGVMRGYTYLAGMQVERAPANGGEPAVPPAATAPPADAGPGPAPGSTPG
jgi:hypothetical protein